MDPSDTNSLTIPVDQSHGDIQKAISDAVQLQSKFTLLLQQNENGGIEEIKE